MACLQPLRGVPFCAAVAGWLVLEGLLSPAAGAQSLVQAARAAEAQRRAVTQPSRVYTNESLGPASLAEPAAPGGAAADGAGAAAPARPGEAPPPDEAAPGAGTDAPRDEGYWRERIQKERDALARAQTFAAALQSQINGLYAEFTACDAPTQCNDITARRQKSLDELERVKQEVVDHGDAVEAIQEEARRAGVPAGWVR